MKRFLATLLALCMCLCVTSVAFAAEATPSTTVYDDWSIQPSSGAVDTISPQTVSGTETWNKGQDYSDWFTMYGTNLTPIKTMGASGTLYLHVTYNSSTPVKLLVQVRKAGTTQVIAQTTIGANTYYEHTVSTLSVTKGQKIQIFFKVLDKNGNYNSNRALNMAYGYMFS